MRSFERSKEQALMGPRMPSPSAEAVIAKLQPFKQLDTPKDSQQKYNRP